MSPICFSKLNENEKIIYIDTINYALKLDGCDIFQMKQAVILKMQSLNY